MTDELKKELEKTIREKIIKIGNISIQIKRIYPVSGVRGNYGYITLLKNPLNPINDFIGVRRGYARLCFKTSGYWICGYQPYQYNAKYNDYTPCIKIRNVYGEYNICNRFFPTPKPNIDFFQIIHRFLARKERWS